jgi:methyltransferase family protein
MDYLPFLKAVHGLLSPETYLEIGVRDGHSMAQAQAPCRCVGIDPTFSILQEINCSVALFRTTSDEYFARPDPLAPTGGVPFDFAFIDGLHIFEFALRDFINAERFSSGKTVIILDDILPRNVDEAARERHTKAWTGDVYPLIDVFARYRPELTVIPIGTSPTGMLLVLGVDPDNTVLADNYDAIMAEFRKPDPQPVPPELMDRLSVVDPDRALSATFWKVLADARREESPVDVRARITQPLIESLGVAFAGS